MNDADMNAQVLSLMAREGGFHDQRCRIDTSSDPTSDRSAVAAQSSLGPHLQWPAFAAARHSRGMLHATLDYLRRIDRGNDWTAFYLVCMAMLPISGLIYVGARLIWPDLHAGYPGADETYTYIAVLSILLIHYLQNGLLFNNSQTLVE